MNDMKTISKDYILAGVICEADTETDITKVLAIGTEEHCKKEARKLVVSKEFGRYIEVFIQEKDVFAAGAKHLQ